MRLRFAIALLIVSAAGLLFFWIRNEVTEQFSEITMDDSTAPSYSVPQRPLSEAELKSDAQVVVLTAQANKVLGNIKQICDDFHLEFVGTKEFVPTQGSISSSGSYLKSPEADFRFWLPTRQITSWNNDTLELALISGSTASSHLSPLGQPWTQEKAFQIGTAFLQVLLNGTDVRLSQGSARFVPQQSKIGTGQWLLTWDRVNSHGYQFHNIEFKVQLPEGYCPIAVQIPEITPYVEESGIPISQADAFARARRGDEKVATKDWSVVRGDSSVPVSESGTPEIVGKRLMWIFWKDPPGDPMDSGPVYIDAYTGETEPFLHHA